jgi:hypothetical protein
LNRGHVGEDQLRGDDLDVTDRVDRSGHMVDVLVLETTDDLNDGIDLPDMGEKLVAQALALAGALDQAGDIDELDSRRDDFFG